MFRSIDTAASGMTAERLRLDVISNNLANANTTRTAAGGPGLSRRGCAGGGSGSARRSCSGAGAAAA